MGHRQTLGRQIVIAALVIGATGGVARADSASKLTKGAVNAATFADKLPPGVLNAATVRAEVLLDRAQASPGVIDGKSGANLKKAIGAFAETHNLPEAKDMSNAVGNELAKDAEPALVDYTIAKEDVAGPFIDELPKDYSDMAKLKALSYTDSAHLLAAKFHMTVTLLKALNPDADLTKAGVPIVVANVRSRPIEGKIASIDIDKSRDQVRALDAGGKLLIAFPATVGSEETPSPSGSYEVRAVAMHPDYTYDPDKNFKQGKNDTKLRIAPGPNNPVGTAFIALTKPTYGIHGTPDPEKIDKAGSHGCVRLTNWDAEKLAHAVKPGVPVRFVE